MTAFSPLQDRLISYSLNFLLWSLLLKTKIVIFSCLVIVRLKFSLSSKWHVTAQKFAREKLNMCFKRNHHHFLCSTPSDLTLVVTNCFTIIPRTLGHFLFADAYLNSSPGSSTKQPGEISEFRRYLIGTCVDCGVQVHVTCILLLRYGLFCFPTFTLGCVPGLPPTLKKPIFSLEHIILSF